jgi:hypothetical protein
LAFEEEVPIRRVTPLSVACLCSITGLAIAEPAAVPSGGNGVELVNGQEGPIGGNALRRYQMVMDARALAGIPVGSVLTGLRFRQDNSSAAPWPPAGITFSDYQLRISAAATSAATMSTTYAANVSGPTTLVMDGPLSIAAGSFPGGPASGATPEAFATVIPFDTPYTYTGGSLCLDFNHSGTGLAVSAFMDAPLSNTTATDFVAGLYSNVSRTAATGVITTYPILRFEYKPPNNEVGPNVLATEEADSGQEGALGGNGARRFQINVDEAALGIPAGSLITGIAFRADNTRAIAWPEANLTIADYEVRVGRGVASTAMSTTFADNDGPDKTLVYDGHLVIPAGTFPANRANFARLLRFQRAFVYQGGDLCVTIRHRGFSGDGIDAAIPLPGSSARSVFSQSFGAATGALLGGVGSPRYFVHRFGYTPSVTTPNALARVEGISGLPIVGENSTIQIIIPASELRAVDVGSALTGMSLRNSTSGGGATFPTANVTLPRFDVRLAPTAVEPLAMSNTFASNVGPGEIVVRDGPIAVPANAFPTSGVPSVPSEFAWFIPFDRAFIYSGGNLCLTIRTSGAMPGNTFLDTDDRDPSARGAMRYTTQNPDALVATNDWGAFVVRFAFTARAFCPWDLNNDGAVDDDDFQIFVVSYDILDCNDGAMPLGCPSDFNDDRVVNDLDFQAFVLAYNELLCP